MTATAPDPPWLLHHAPYRPWMDDRTARPPGLMPLGDLPLVTADPDFAAQLAERERLLRVAPGRVIAWLPEGRRPARELLRLIAGDAAEYDRPDGVRVALDHDRPLDSLGRMTAEDWCLLAPGGAPSDEYRLVAAVLCFPARWLLAEKLGRPLTRIHRPVPGYAEGLAKRVNRVFRTLRPGRPLWRANWLVQATAALHLPKSEDDHRAAAEDPAGRLFVRTERQTLTRLPGSGAVAFGIKTSLTLLSSLPGREQAALRARLLATPPEDLAYRSSDQPHARALAALARSTPVCD